MEAWDVNSIPRISLIRLTVNGEDAPSPSPTTRLQDLVQQVGRDYGLRTVTVLVNGEVLETRVGPQTLAALQAETVEIITKDKRA